MRRKRVLAVLPLGVLLVRRWPLPARLAVALTGASSVLLLGRDAPPARRGTDGARAAVTLPAPPTPPPRPGARRRPDHPDPDRADAPPGAYLRGGSRREAIVVAVVVVLTVVAIAVAFVLFREPEVARLPGS